MPQIDIPPDRVRDPWEKNLPGIGVGRDGCRTPMQWDSTPHGGFSATEPWLPLDENFARDNVAVERQNPTSMLSLYRALIDLRRTRPELALGAYGPVSVTGELLMFERERQGQRLLVALNLGAASVATAIGLRGRILLSTFMDRQAETVDGKLELRGAEGIILEPLE
jgi:alpha-glucosidase